MALSKDRNLVDQEGKTLAHPLAASTTIYKGALVMHNSSGYLAPLAAGAGNNFAGVALEHAENAGAAGAALSGLIQKEGCVELPGTGFTQADVGKIVYGADDETVTVTEGTGSKVIVGKIEKYISSTKVLVRLTVLAGTGKAS